MQPGYWHGWNKASNPLLYNPLSACPAGTEGTDPCVGTVRPWLQLAHDFQEEFRGSFLFVLSVLFLSLVVAAFLLPAFYVKAMGAVTCCRSTGVQVCWVHLSPWSVGQCILKGMAHAPWIAVNVFFIPWLQLWGPWCTGWGRWWDESHQNNSGSGSFSSEGFWVSAVLCLNFMSFVHSLL